MGSMSEGVIQEGKTTILTKIIKDGRMTEDEAAQRVNLPLDYFIERMQYVNMDEESICHSYDEMMAEINSIETSSHQTIADQIQVMDLWRKIVYESGKLLILLELINGGNIDFEYAAQLMGLTVDDLKDEFVKYGFLKE